MATAKKNTTSTSKAGSKIVASKGKFSLSSLQKKLIAVAAVVVLGAGGFWLYNDLQDGQLFAASCNNQTFRQGSKGNCVKYIQTLVNYHDSRTADISIDGAFGAKTTTKVKTFQKTFGITADGIVGKKTWGLLCDTHKGYSTSSGSYGVFSSQAAYNAAKAAGCNMRNIVVQVR